jgi:hypothetical protein
MTTHANHRNAWQDFRLLVCQRSKAAPIPFTRSIVNKGFYELCSKSAVNWPQFFYLKSVGFQLLLLSVEAIRQPRHQRQLFLKVLNFNCPVLGVS